MKANNSALLRYAMIISVQKLAGDKVKYNRLRKKERSKINKKR